ncbi:conserved hypothetical protein [uncultured Defluviicoccus sp.]|uniref:Uncharacterized protein n=1 Tax=metagenome TaxID=256318 RepID=A0A380TGL4_9ZZZZ|nr:conserved hypothetical protein [uncultured Defluviicoccus sp.]
MMDRVTHEPTQRAAMDPDSNVRTPGEVTPLDSGTPAAGVFDYAPLPAECAAEVRTVAERIRTRTALAIIENGRDLIKVRSLPEMKGRFGAWLLAEFSMSPGTAYNMMQAAENLGDRFVNFTNVAPSVLYAIGAPSTPDTVRAEVETRAASGEKITVAEVERLKREARAAEEMSFQIEGERAAMRAVVEQARRDVESARAKAAKARTAAEDAVRQAREEAEQAATLKAEAFAEEALARRRGELAEIERRAQVAEEKAQRHHEAEQRLAAEIQQHQATLGRLSSAEHEAPELIEAADKLMRALTDAMIMLHGCAHTPLPPVARKWTTAQQMSGKLAAAITAFLRPRLAETAP